ncbi:MAG: lysophospholipid acyltransferase family protein [Desulfuromonadaceae bacterium]|nr:lysophospholipid acyltransferase family protein [Desulfuromonadaceae bacterium]
MAKKGIYTDGDWAKSSLHIIRALERCGCTFDIRGMEALCNNPQPCVFIANHMSTLETFVLPTLIAPYQRVTFVVKKSLVEYPLFKHVMRSRNPVLVNRTNAREDLKAVLTQGVERLHSGVSIVVFPQTTRTTGFSPENFNSIGLKLAKKAGVPVVPLALKTDAWGNGCCLKDFGRIAPERTIHFEFGPYIAADKLDKDTHTDITDFIQNRMHEWEQA